MKMRVKNTHRSRSPFSSLAVKVNCFGNIHILKKEMILAIHLAWLLAPSALNWIFWDDAPPKNNNANSKSFLESLRGWFSVVNNILLIKLIISSFMSAIHCAAISSVKASSNFCRSIYSQKSLKRLKSWISGAVHVGITVLNAAPAINSSTWCRHAKYNGYQPKSCFMTRVGNLWPTGRIRPAKAFYPACNHLLSSGLRPFFFFNNSYAAV